MQAPLPEPFSSGPRGSPQGPLSGTVRVPGDKSISHRALMLAALAVGESRIRGLLEGDDVLATATALRAMGAAIERGDDGVWTVHGVGVGGLLQPESALEMGNSGTSTRLLMGLVSSHPLSATFTGDASLSRRPMARVMEPLAKMGADVTASPGGRLPLMVRGLCPAVPISYTPPIASAQVKSAVLLAALNTPGTTRVIEPVPTRDHSERMLAAFGAALTVEESDAGRVISLTGEVDLRAQSVIVPGDPSSAAFPLVAALLVPESDIVVENVGINATRAGLFGVLRAMGADLCYENEREVGGEPVADIRARHSALTGIDIAPEVAPSMIDEYPILFVAAALAGGRTTARGIGELRVKESDRLALMARGLSRLGVAVVESEDGVAIDGRGGERFAPDGETTVAAELDHRVAMAFAVAGLVSRASVTIDDMAPVRTSFPGFLPLMRSLGAWA